MPKFHLNSFCSDFTGKLEDSPKVIAFYVDYSFPKITWRIQELKKTFTTKHLTWNFLIYFYNVVIKQITFKEFECRINLNGLE